MIQIAIALPNYITPPAIPRAFSATEVSNFDPIGPPIPAISSAFIPPATTLNPPPAI